ncbi:UNVERIFIED_CONTAM: Retrovirus-related Pol polyprotein from transposon RE1 [Sesamum latifolium]|uniref:Retrovirus-related Pol polyprotein from transposon RE1 n=1 Tax=Sesamum latifolium TaxID=2727402 RepID=A0AAW2TCI9_9LAMI
MTEFSTAIPAAQATDSAEDQYEQAVLYLHPSDNSSFVLASSPLTGSNFLAWSRAVYVSLGCKMKLGFIDDTFPRSTTGSAKFEQWQRADPMVTSWLWNSISKEIVEAFMYASSSRELWLEIQSRYERSNGPMVYQIQREISSISQEVLSRTTYLTEVKKLWNQLTCLAPSPKCTCGYCVCGVNKAISDRDASTQLMQFLMGLHESFDKEKSQVLMMDPLPDIEKAFSMIFSVEQQRSVQVNLADTSSNAAYQLTLNDNRREAGHLKDSCFQLHGVPDWYKNLSDKKKKAVGNNNFAGTVGDRGVGTVINPGVSGNNKADVTDLVTELVRMVQNRTMPSDPISNFANYVQSDAEFAGNTSSSSANVFSDWIIDTGATNHICAHLSLFHSYSKPTHPRFIHLPDGSKKEVIYTGVVKLSDKLILNFVSYIPDFSVNLLSVSQLCRNTTYIFSFTQSSWILQDQVTKEIMAVGSLHRKLYVLKSCDLKHSDNSIVSLTDVSCSTSVHCNDSLWHKRLGHASMHAIKHIFDCNIYDNSLDMVCDVCPKAKQSRVPFPLSESHSEIAFELIHLDVWGPYKTATSSGCNYILTILDDYTRSLWTYYSKHKSQVPSILLTFSNMVGTQFGAKIKTLRSDNGLEFINKDCQSLCHSLGIIHQTSCVYTPQQNGRVERKHRHLLNVARAILFQASLPIRFWGDSILTATFLINRTPTKTLNWISPFQALYGSPPSYAHLRTFGCLCFGTNLDPHKTKFHKRAHMCLFLGYATNQKAYKLYDLDEHTYFTSRDVVFHEDIFPYKLASPSDSTSCPLPIVVEDYNDTYSDHLMLEPSIQSSPIAVSENHTDTPHTVTPHSVTPDTSPLVLPRRGSQHPEWKTTMDAEIQALETNRTWKLTPLPAGKKTIGCKWVYKTKPRADGSVERHKARLVAKGYNQVEGIDYTDSFSLVAKAVTVRLFLTLAAAKGWVLQQLDINNAFLHGYLDEDIYMIPPDGYPVKPGLVCKLERSLYGLKQASRQWNVELTVKLQEFGFVQSVHDHCLFILHTTRGLLALLVYVDDILLTGPSMDDLQSVKSYLHDPFTIKDIGDARYFLGLEIARSSNGIYLAQTKYNPDSYRRLVGRLLYLGFTRPDLSHSVQQLSQFLNRLCEAHWTAALHVVRYLKGCPSKGLFLPATSSLVLKGYCDAD